MTVLLHRPACDIPDGCGAPAGHPCEPGCPSLTTEEAAAGTAAAGSDEDPVPFSVVTFITSPEHDELIKMAERTHLGSVFATCEEQQHTVTGACTVLADLLARTDRLRYEVRPDGASHLVHDRWTGHTVHGPTGHAAAKDFTRDANERNARDGAAHLTASLAAVDHYRGMPG